MMSELVLDALLAHRGDHRDRTPNLPYPYD